jgi:uncharacterized protein YecE (DUF72 family)
MKNNIYIGVAGWSYPDWNGIVYTSSKIDHLKYLSRFVDCIEINTTFYQLPQEKNSKSWLDKTKDKKEFFFTAKLHKDFTHEGKIDPGMVKQFHRGFEPLLNEGRLRKLLIQFPYNFYDTIDNREHLSKIIKSFKDNFDLAIEVRHKSWEKKDALKYLGDNAVTVCNLDYPVANYSFNLQNCTIGSNGYMRLHGRNEESWFDKDSGRDETYNYYYGDKELEQIKKRIEELSKAYQ